MYLVKEGRKKRKSHGPASAKPAPGRRLSIFNVSSATRECRICFMGDEKEGAPDGKRGDDELIAPCRCDGSMKWVHRGCLAGWNKRAPSKKHCPVCK
jgi:E3 ubiquitin-protein ligase DOA10